MELMHLEDGVPGSSNQSLLTTASAVMLPHTNSLPSHLSPCPSLLLLWYVLPKKAEASASG